MFLLKAIFYLIACLVHIGTHRGFFVFPLGLLNLLFGWVRFARICELHKKNWLL